MLLALTPSGASAFPLTAAALAAAVAARVAMSPRARIWTRRRDCWEHSHVWRAATAAAAFVLATLALAGR